jgi:MFS family permease
MGFEYLFYFLAGFIGLIGLIGAVLVIPSRINRTEQTEDSTKTVITYCDFFKRYRTLSVMIVGFFSIVPLIFIDAVLALWLLELGMSEETVGFGFSVNTFFYGVGSYLTGLLCNKMDRRIVLVIFLYLTVIADLLTGPSEFLGLTPHIWLVMLGLALLGVATGGCFVPIVPELIAGLLDSLDADSITPEVLDQIKDKASALYGLQFGLGFIIAPITAGAFVDYGGF